MYGKAYLVGAGPGDPDLITVRGLRLLRNADVVVYDRLSPAELLDEARVDAEILYVGKEPGNHSLTQAEINELLVDRVRKGLQVVRFKGGDPFVFGRGGEEALALAEADVPFEVIPGITAAIAVPAAAGIPVTHRGLAGSFAVVNGHNAQESGGSETWKSLAHIATIVILMGVSNINAVASELLLAGKKPDTPAAVIQEGTTEKQQVYLTTLSDLPTVVREQAVKSPATIVVGEVSLLSRRLHG